MQIFHDYISKFDIAALCYDNETHKQAFFNALNWTHTTTEEQGSPVPLPCNEHNHMD